MRSRPFENEKPAVPHTRAPYLSVFDQQMGDRIRSGALAAVSNGFGIHRTHTHETPAACDGIYRSAPVTPTRSKSTSASSAADAEPRTQRARARRTRDGSVTAPRERRHSSEQLALSGRRGIPGDGTGRRVRGSSIGSDRLIQTRRARSGSLSSRAGGNRIDVSRRLPSPRVGMTAHTQRFHPDLDTADGGRDGSIRSPS